LQTVKVPQRAQEDRRKAAFRFKKLSANLHYSIFGDHEISHDEEKKRGW
jgi:hypothetical protein